jgi:cyclopropane fatty-acyl-phospholipid synthase-like methyltransferase
VGSARDGPVRGSADWSSYWEELEDVQEIFPAEAHDYVRRLDSALGLEPGARVLDFGCGFGFVAAALASRVAELALWDASANVRRRAHRRIGGLANVRFVDLSEPAHLPADLSFDLILVNSVAQYMADDEFLLWLELWQQMLAKEGRLVVSDLVPLDHRALAEVGALLGFSARHGFLGRAVWQGLRELGRYARMRSVRPLRRVAPEDLRDQAEAVGLAVRFLPTNLTYRTRRLTAVLSHADEADD